MSPSSQNDPATEQVQTPTDRESRRGPVQRYEITWLSGHVETIIAHQVSWPNNGANLFGAKRPVRIQFHAEVDGRWTLQLSALEDDLRTVRNVTDGEDILGGVR